MPVTKDHASNGRPRLRKSVGKMARLEARLPAEQKAILQRAADLNHQRLSEFVIHSAIQAAEESIRQHQVIALSASDSLAVMEALLNPAPANEALRRAAERYKTFMGQ